MHANAVLEEDIQRTGFRWIDNFFEICPDEMLHFVPRLLALVLPAISHDFETVRESAHRVNASLLDLILSLPSETPLVDGNTSPAVSKVPNPSHANKRDSSVARVSTPVPQSSTPISLSLKGEEDQALETVPVLDTPAPELDYFATVNALTLQFLNEHEETRVVALDWLIMLHKKAHKKVVVQP